MRRSVIVTAVCLGVVAVVAFRLGQRSTIPAQQSTFLRYRADFDRVAAQVLGLDESEVDSAQRQLLGQLQHTGVSRIVREQDRVTFAFPFLPTDAIPAVVFTRTPDDAPWNPELWGSRTLHAYVRLDENWAFVHYDVP